MGIISYIKNYKLKKQQLQKEKYRRAEEAKLKQIAEQKQLYRITKQKVDNCLAKLNKQDRDAYNKAYDLHKTYAKKHNSTCPICGSTNVHNEYKRVVGELSGSSSSHGSSSYSHGLFFGSGSSSYNSHGKIDGSLDTVKVLKCSDCNHEWEPISEFLSSLEWYRGKIQLDNDIESFMRRIRFILEVKFDSEDITEEFNSYEEKRSAEINKFWNWIENYEYLKELPIEALWALTVKYSYNIFHYTLEIIWSKKTEIDNWGDYRDCTTDSTKRDAYICEFSPNVINLLEELGFKHIDLTVNNE